MNCTFGWAEPSAIHSSFCRLCSINLYWKLLFILRHIGGRQSKCLSPLSGSSLWQMDLRFGALLIPHLILKRWMIISATSQVWNADAEHDDLLYMGGYGFSDLTSSMATTSATLFQYQKAAIHLNFFGPRRFISFPLLRFDLWFVHKFQTSKRGFLINKIRWSMITLFYLYLSTRHDVIYQNILSHRLPFIKRRKIKNKKYLNEI